MAPLLATSLDGLITPLNAQRMDHFRKHLANLTQEPITTPEYRSPLLNQLLMTRDEIDDEDQVEIGNMAPPPIRNTWQHSR